MSVFYQAVLDGRINRSTCTANGRRNKGIARELRIVKREEADERNVHTPFPSRKAYRRALAADLAEAAKRRKAGK